MAADLAAFHGIIPDEPSPALRILKKRKESKRCREYTHLSVITLVPCCLENNHEGDHYSSVHEHWWPNDNEEYIEFEFLR